ncbi:Hypothetical protein A7982_00261 [Minicystis rosea]|nr:Hypothetical protein A7982_00261 [Minicystis rosea]
MLSPSAIVRGAREPPFTTRSAVDPERRARPPSMEAAHRDEDRSLTAT